MSSKFKVLLVYPNIQLVNLIPNNIGILTACLRQAGHEVKLFDTTFYKIKEKSDDEIRAEWGHYKPSDNTALYKTTNVYDDFKALYDNYKPNLIGFSCVDATYPIAKSLLDKIDTKDCHVIFGGLYPTFAYNEIWNNHQIDSICIGEGEEAIVELCNHISKGYGWRGLFSNPTIKNLHFDKGGIINTNKCRPLCDIDKLPYEDFTDFEEKRFLRPMQGKLKRMVPLNIDRGCPYGCKFCAEPSIKAMFGDNYYRIKSLSKMPEYLSYLKTTYKPEYMYFNSETFLARPSDHIERFAKLYEQHLNLPFCCMTRFETVTEKNIKLLKEMGCDRLSFGLEHGNEKYRKEIFNKRFTNQQVFDAIQICNDNKLNISLFNMIGSPDETEKLALETIDLNRQILHKFKDINITNSISIFQPYRSSQLRQYSIEKGYITNDIEGSGLITESVMNMPNFSKERIFELTRDFVKLANQR